MEALLLADFEGMTVGEVEAYIIEEYRDYDGYDYDRGKDQKILDAAKDEIRKQLSQFDILIAYENLDGYEATSFFLLRDITTEKLYEVHGGHCSCCGFEGQFKPEETTVEYLKKQGAGVGVIPIGKYTSECEKEASKKVTEYILANF